MSRFTLFKYPFKRLLYDIIYLYPQSARRDSAHNYRGNYSQYIRNDWRRASLLPVPHNSFIHLRRGGAVICCHFLSPSSIFLDCSTGGLDILRGLSLSVGTDPHQAQSQISSEPYILLHFGFAINVSVKVTTVSSFFFVSFRFAVSVLCS